MFLRFTDNNPNLVEEEQGKGEFPAPVVNLSEVMGNQFCGPKSELLKDTFGDSDKSKNINYSKIEKNQKHKENMKMEKSNKKIVKNNNSLYLDSQQVFEKMKITVPEIENKNFELGKKI